VRDCASAGILLQFGVVSLRAWFRDRTASKLAYAGRPSVLFQNRGFSSRRFRRCAPGIAAGKQAAAEEGAFERPIAVHAAAEAGRFAGGVKPRHDLAVTAEHARVEVGLEPAQRQILRHLWFLTAVTCPVWRTFRTAPTDSSRVTHKRAREIVSG